VKRYQTVRPFLPMLSKVIGFGAVDAGQPILDAVRRLSELIGRKRARQEEVARELVTGGWRRLVFENLDLQPGVVDHRAYAFCVLKQLHRALGRRRADRGPARLRHRGGSGRGLQHRIPAGRQAGRAGADARPPIPRGPELRPQRDDRGRQYAAAGRPGPDPAGGRLGQWAGGIGGRPGLRVRTFQSGAGDGTRTRYLNLGKYELCLESRAAATPS
jgi:hypothetical protein